MNQVTRQPSIAIQQITRDQRAQSCYDDWFVNTRKEALSGWTSGSLQIFERARSAVDYLDAQGRYVEAETWFAIIMNAQLDALEGFTPCYSGSS